MRGKVGLMAAAVVLAGMAAPAAALTEEQAECVARAAPAGFAARLASVMLSGQASPPEKEALMRQLATISEACAEMTGIPADRRQAYFDYWQARIPRDELSRQLVAAGIPLEPIDDILDLGPGRSNPEIQGVTDGQAALISAALKARGVAVDRVGDETWNKVGGYIAGTSLMFQRLRALP